MKKNKRTARKPRSSARPTAATTARRPVRDSDGPVFEAKELGVLESIDRFDAVLRAAPDDWATHGKRAACLLEAGRIEEAEAAAQDVIRHDKTNAFANSVLAYLRWKDEDYKAAFSYGAHAVKGEPDNYVNWLVYGIAGRMQHHPAGLAALTRAIQLKPDSREAHVHLAAFLQAWGHLDAAAFMNKKALELWPRSPLARGTESALEWRRGNIDAAAAHAEAAYRDERTTYSLASLTVFMAICSTWPERAIHDKAREIMGLLREALRGQRLPVGTDRRPADRTPRPLQRIGFVGGDFRRHSVAFFLVPLLGHLVDAGLEIYAYSSTEVEDDVTKAIEDSITIFRRVRRSTDLEIADLVRQDRIDILIDLAGHTGGSRPPLMMYKPAPVQVEYLGFPGSTGIAEIDYRISDHQADPAGVADTVSSETIIRLPRGFHCYHPLGTLPAIARQEGGPPVVGSFNASHKYSPHLIRCWARIAQQVPDLRFYIKLFTSDDDSFERLFMKQFAAAGMNTDNIEVARRKKSFQEHMAEYNRLDLSLDTYPYNGTTTTCEALAMGVPVVTLRGDRHAARVGASLLTNLGMPDLIADSEEAYVDLVVDLLRSPDRLAGLRAGLRERFLASPICDRAAFGGDFVEALQTMWADAGMASHAA